MSDRRIIYDSEDEDGGFSPISSPAKDNAPNVALTTEGGDGRQAEEPNSDLRSTDPEFFKQIYEEQQRVTRDKEVQREKDALGKQRNLYPEAKDNSSSLTDPTAPRSSKKKTKGKLIPASFADMTQVTTPDTPLTKRKDVYDFDFSDEEGTSGKTPITKKNSKATRLNGKCKTRTAGTAVEGATHSSPPQLSTKTQGSSVNHPIPIEDESPPTRKKRKSGSKQPQYLVPDDMDLLVVPTTAETDQGFAEMHEESDDLGTVVHDTFETREVTKGLSPASFFIAPPTRFTASQKQEYERLSGSSELDREENAAGQKDSYLQITGDFGLDKYDDEVQASLPVPKPQTQGQRSTNTESTIPYTTPSRYCSSAAPLGIPEDHIVSELDPSSERRTHLDRMQPSFSPDELSLHPIEPMSSRMKRKRGPGMDDELTQDDDSWDSDKIGYSREHYVPRPNRRRSMVVLEEVEESEAPKQSMPDTCPPGEAGQEGMDMDLVFNDGQQAPQGVEIEGLDADFLAAMPEDIRQELLSGHITQQSMGNMQFARTRSRARPSDALSGLLQVPAEISQPKKRGRKKKEEKEEVGLDTAESVAPPSLTPASLAKRKRGRPKKSETAQPPPASLSDEDTTSTKELEAQPEVSDKPSPTNVSPVDLGHVSAEPAKAPSKRGRKKKVVKETPASVSGDCNPSIHEVEGLAEVPRDTDNVQVEEQNAEMLNDVSTAGGREALQDISNTGSQKGSDTGNGYATNELHVERQKEDILDLDSKEVSKAASTTSQQDKVRFRVGLSKRSRIAPLLKVIRK